MTVDEAIAEARAGEVPAVACWAALQVYWLRKSEQTAARDRLDEAEDALSDAEAALETAICDKLGEAPPHSEDDPVTLAIGDTLIRLLPHDTRPSLSIEPLRRL